MRIPVIGVFHAEVDHLHGWLSSVEAQRSAHVEPIPVVVVSPHPEHLPNLKAVLKQCVAEGRLSNDHTIILDWNRGPTAAFNVGAKKFTEQPDEFPWIASLDPDARFAPGAIAQLLTIGSEMPKTGMVSPLVLQPREHDDFAAPVSPEERVCHAGHFPRMPRRHRSSVTNFWDSHFRNSKVDRVRHFLTTNPQAQPFCACFCASLWNSQMFYEIQLPDTRQFRTLNCGEIGYRAQLTEWIGRFSRDAFAFHPNASDHDYSPSAAMARFGSTGWHYYHAQGLISLRYFPDEHRNTAAVSAGRDVPWDELFGDLANIEPYIDQASRRNLFDRWHTFHIM